MKNHNRSMIKNAMAIVASEQVSPCSSFLKQLLNSSK